ncbi:hypothetical protein QMT40_002699 [Parvibaculaceae bacterium PLY_AMNH_Bact1]|nr:hypothetical protein QMT40_002699 [Parvibaculaceae bacterium PLY_AMNH_Bact1]
MTSQTMADLPDKYLFYWDQKLVRLLGGRPWRAGVIIAVFAFLSFLALAQGFGIYELVYSDVIPDLARTFGMDPYTWAAFVTSLLIGFGVSASSVALVQDVRDMGEIATVIGRDPDEMTNDWVDHLRARMGRGRVVAIVFFMVGFAIVMNSIPGASDVFNLHEPELYPWFQQVPAAWFLVFVPLNFALIGKGVYLSVVEDRFHLKTRNASLKIDLFHPEQLGPFTRMALRRSLLWIVGSSICLLLFLNEAVDPTALLPFVLAIMVVASAALITPLIGIHRKISAEKKKELRTVRTSIVKLRDEVLHGTNPTIASNAAQRLTGLVAYEGRLERTSEWPIDLPTLGTFSFYLAIPVISWVGGALMERAIDFLF